MTSNDRLDDLNGERKKTLFERIGTPERGEEISDIGVLEIELLGESLKLQSGVLNVAKAISKRAIQNRTIVENCSLAALSTCAVYLACRTENLGYDPSAISKESIISERLLREKFTLVKNELDLEIGPVDPENYVQRFCEDLELSAKVEEKAIQIIEASKHDVLSGRSPSGFAAAAVYASSLLCNEARSQAVIAKETGVSTRTIRDTYQLQIHSMGISDNDSD